MRKAFRRHDGRRADELRPVKIMPGYVRTADGSCLIEVGGTRVICTASFAEGVPAWRKGSGTGWVTAEYGMLPGSTPARKPRPIGRPDSRGMEIQRLIGRVLRSVVDFKKLGENTIMVDCDVLEADGGTRTAAITGAYVALVLAVRRAAARGSCRQTVVTGAVAGVSAGIVEGEAMLDLDYLEDSAAEVDMNMAMTARGKLVEVQATGERGGFDLDRLQHLLALARRGIKKLLRVQKDALLRGGRRR